MSLQRLIITFKADEIVLHTLYRTQDGTDSGTKVRCKEVTGLTRSGLTQTLEALESAECVGTSGFTTREDVSWPQPHQMQQPK